LGACPFNLRPQAHCAGGDRDSSGLHFELRHVRAQAPVCHPLPAGFPTGKVLKINRFLVKKKIKTKFVKLCFCMTLCVGGRVEEIFSCFYNMKQTFLFFFISVFLGYQFSKKLKIDKFL
jgi:hypothetical protein